MPDDRHRVADAPRLVAVPLRRLDRWLAGFIHRHGAWSPAYQLHPGGWLLTAADGTTAFVAEPVWLAHVVDVCDVDTLDGLPHIAPRFGVLLLRRAAYAVGAFDGDHLVDRKIGTRHIHGRTAAGGWSQQRYARRRANQGDEIVSAAVQHAERILGGLPNMHFLVTGGDRPLLAAAQRSAGPGIAGLPVAMHLGMGNPDSAVLASVPDRVLAVQIAIKDSAQ
jgi:hypothetical protein